MYMYVTKLDCLDFFSKVPLSNDDFLLTVSVSKQFYPVFSEHRDLNYVRWGNAN